MQNITPPPPVVEYFTPITRRFILLFLLFSAIISSVSKADECLPPGCNPTITQHSAYMTFNGINCQVPVYWTVYTCSNGDTYIVIDAIRTDQAIGSDCTALINYFYPTTGTRWDRLRQAFEDAVDVAGKTEFLIIYNALPQNQKQQYNCPGTMTIKSGTFKSCSRVTQCTGQNNMPYASIGRCGISEVCCIRVMEICNQNGVPQIQNEYWENSLPGDQCPSNEPPPPSGCTSGPCFQPCEEGE